MIGNNWHARSIEEVATEFGTDPLLGLSTEERRARFKKYGRNALPERTDFRALKIIFAQFTNPLALILIVADIVSFSLGEFSDTLVIAIAVLINASIGAYQEGRADRAFQKLKVSVRRRAIVFSEGHETEIEAETLVPGDVIAVRAGDIIPADARLSEAKNLSVNESVLTGEWLPAEKAAAVLPVKTHIAERINLLFMGTAVTEGWGRAIIVGTGAKTEFGKIAATIKIKPIATPFQKGVRHLARLIGAVVLIAALAVFALGVLRGEQPIRMFIVAVAIAVAAVPEGLPMAATAILAVGMGRILARGGLVKNLLAAETLGSATVILTDKTGTLTKAEMQVAEILTSEEVLSGAISEDKILAAKFRTLETAILSADAFIENPDAELKDWIVRGKPTERAIFLSGIESGLHPQKLRETNRRLDFFPFDAERRVAASLNRIDDMTQISIAGAPEKILTFSGFIPDGGGAVKISEKMRGKLSAAYERLVAGGSRVLGVAYRRNGWTTFGDQNEIFQNFIFAGFIAFHDPLRHDAHHSLVEARSAGVRTVMLTGDHPTTATVVAKAAGLMDEAGRIVDGMELDGMSDEELDEQLPTMNGFARVLPHQKMRIVEAWQKRGAIVAMTGDGVNDVPAMTRADIGIALGSGTDVAKEAADLVLTNNSFSVIVAAIEEGRTIMDNLRKVVTFLLATGFTEVILVGGALIAGLPLPILPAHILWANLVEEGFMNFAFAFEPKEKEIMRRKPQETSSARILTPEMTWIIFGIGIMTDIFLFILYLALLDAGRPLAEIRSVMFAGLAIDAVFFVYAIKDLHRPIWRTNIFSNRYLIFSSVISIAMLVFAFALPSLRGLLSLELIGWNEFATIAALGFLDLAAIEAAKYMFYWRTQSVKMNV